MSKTNENWMVRNWRPLCGVVYMVICLTDFVFMPVYYAYQNSRYSPERVIQIVQTLDDQRVEAIRALRDQQMWKPVTLDGAGTVHLAFLTILGVAAWTRGHEKIERVRSNRYTPTPRDDGDDYGHDSYRPSRSRYSRSADDPDDSGDYPPDDPMHPNNRGR